MGWLHQLSLLPTAVSNLLPYLQEKEKFVLGKMDQSGATVFVNSYRALQMHRCVVAVGMFSLFESTLKQVHGWENPISRAKGELSKKGKAELLQRFESYWLANNVLKHGEGRSYSELLTMKPKPEFRISRPGEPLFEEGDIADIGTLVDVDDSFLRNSAQMIDEVICCLSEYMP